MNKDDNTADGSLLGRDDALVLYRDLEKHSCGEFSFVVVQANKDMKDHSHVKTACNATFVGVYDGHSGSEASRLFSARLIPHLISESDSHS